MHRPRSGAAEADVAAWLLCRVAAFLCALPIERVGEVMRPLPIKPLSGMPTLLLGLCIIRGAPVPVVDTGVLLNGSASRAARLVTLAVGDRTLALAVEQVIGVRSIDPGTLSRLPTLLQDAAGEAAVEAIRVLDGEFLLLLDTARIVPDALFEELRAAELAR